MTAKSFSDGEFAAVILMAILIGLLLTPILGASTWATLLFSAWMIWMCIRRLGPAL